MTALDLKGINKSFGTNHVLRDIDLHIGDGEFIVIVGPSGCGKSTLLRVVAGLEVPNSGQIEIDGEVVNDMPPARRDIAMVFQSYALYPHMTVTGNLTFPLKMIHLSDEEIAQRIAETSATLDLEPYLERKPSELSGGQRQRVSLGRALVRQPSIFLFDEPLSNLDAALRMQTRVEIARLHRTLGTTIIYVTHDQTEAMTLADTIVVMNKGRIEQTGPPLELYNKPANRFVAGFLGSPAMNFIESERLSIAGAATVGLRPEHLQPVAQGRLAGKVVHFERLGTDTHVIVDIGTDEHLTVRMVGQHEFGLDETVSLDFDDQNALLFDEAGMRIEPETKAPMAALLEEGA